MGKPAVKSAEIVDFFKVSDRSVSTPATKPKKDKAPKFAVAGLMDYVSLAIVERRAKKEKDEQGELLREDLWDRFVIQGFAGKARPANFQAVENDATASIELKDRNTNGLTDDEIKTLRLHNVPTVDIGVPETLRVNPEYLTDKELLTKVNEALAKVPGLPRDFIQTVPAQTAVIPAPDAHTVIWRKKPEIIEKLLPILFTLAISQTKIDDTKIALRQVNRYLGLDKKEDEQATEA